MDFKRRYYLDKENNQRVYLLNEYFKIAPNERLLENVETKLIEEAVVYPLKLIRVIEII